jgi:hypothetical protein
MASLFGPTPQELIFARMKEDEKMRALRNQQIGQEGGEFGVFAPLYQAGRRFGEMGSQAIVQGLFPQASDPSISQAQTVQMVQQKYQGQNLSDPTVLKSIASDLFNAGAPDAGLRILKTAQDLTPKDKFITGKAGDIIYRQTPTGTLEQVAAVPDKDKIPAAKEQADRIRLEELQTQFGPVEGARRFREERDAEERRRVAAGVPPSGQVKVTDLNTATQLVDRFVKGPQEKLSTARDARSQLVLARKGEGAAFAQLQRQLVKLVGDSQIGMGEVRAALGSAGIVGNTISAVNQFMTGVPSADKLDSVEQVINALEDINAQSYNSGRKRAESVLNEANLSEGTRKSLIPPAYKTGREKKTGGFVEGKIYKDAKGNRARYVNGEWEPVQ